MSKRKVFVFCCWMLLAVSPATASEGDSWGSVIFGRPIELVLGQFEIDLH
jgi:hypothetical protein